MIDFDRYDVLTFDCYGTLIDWESGLTAALAPFDPEPGRFLETFGALESELQSGPYLPYREVLRRALAGLGDRFGFSPTREQTETFAASVGDWPAFPDSKQALAKLKERYRLGVVSNVDDDLFAASSRKLGDPFTWVVTAERTRVYKPDPKAFERALERIGVPKERVLHVAQSRFHDVAPAKALGLATVWVNRRGGEGGGGATPASCAVADLEVPDLGAIARLTSP